MHRKIKVKHCIKCFAIWLLKEVFDKCPYCGEKLEIIET